MRAKKCIVCGEVYLGEGAYCSTKCQKENEKIKEHAKQILNGTKKRKKKLKHPLAILNDQARKAGMSYGQYVAWQQAEAERKKRKKNNGKIG